MTTQAFITVANLESRYTAAEVVRLTASGITAQSAVDDVNALASAYVGTSYTLPFAVVPPELVAPLCDLSVLRLYKTEAPLHLQEKGKAAMRFLEAIAARKVSLSLTDDPLTTTVDEAQTDSISYTVNERQLSGAILSGW